MEKTFVRILNRTLLVVCLLLLIGTGMMAAFAAYNYSVSFPNDAPQGLITAPITSFAQGKLASQQLAQSDAGSVSTAPQIDPKLSPDAYRLCSARSRFVMALTNAALKISNTGVCAKSAADEAANFGDRANNYLVEQARHFDALAADPDAKTFTAARDAETISKILAGTISRFDQRFSSIVAQQEAEKTRQAAEAAEHRVTALWALGIAGGIFATFLIAAFFIVFVRMEKHLDRLADSSAKQPT